MPNQGLANLQLQPTDWEDYIDILVDGAPLAERLMAADREIKDVYVYDDTGLGWGCVDGSYNTVFNRGVFTPGVYPGLLLLTCCGCNFTGCGDSVATVTTIDVTISLGTFSRPKRELASVAPVVFRRDQFIAEVERINQWFAATYPEAQLRKAQARANRSRLGL